MKDKFTIVGDQLQGRGLAFDIGPFVKADPETGTELIAMGEAIYLQGRDSVSLDYNDRFDLDMAAEALRALAVIVGPTAGHRHQRAADAISRLLQKQRENP